MKRWALGLFGTSAIIGLGWLGIAWSQHHTGSQDSPLPDLTKPPVNADAASWADNQGLRADRPRSRHHRKRGCPIGRRPMPVDPFQGVSQSAADLNSPSVNGATTVNESSKDAPAARQIVGDRYANDPRYGVTQASATASQPMNTEPQPIHSDPAAQPIAPDPTANRNGWGDSPAATDNRSTPVDYRNQSPDSAATGSTAIVAPPSSPSDRHSAPYLQSRIESIQFRAEL